MTPDGCSVHHERLARLRRALPDAMMADVDGLLADRDARIVALEAECERMRVGLLNLSPDTLSPQEILNNVAWALNGAPRTYAGEMHPDKSLFDLARERDALVAHCERLREELEWAGMPWERTDGWEGKRCPWCRGIPPDSNPSLAPRYTIGHSADCFIGIALAATPTASLAAAREDRRRLVERAVERGIAEAKDALGVHTSTAIAVPAIAARILAAHEGRTP